MILYCFRWQGLGLYPGAHPAPHRHPLAGLLRPHGAAGESRNRWKTPGGSPLFQIFPIGFLNLRQIIFDNL